MLSTLADVVEYGEYLEHFHSYQKLSDDDDDGGYSCAAAATIDLHTDQGLFLAFTPGRMMTSGELTNGFFIETQDGSIQQVEFSESDDLRQRQS